MEKICEFCTSLRPVVYCKADAALLCLSCDAKVHSANALSNRHPRTLLCESCKCRPTSLRCLDHRVFLCRNCDRSLHEVSSQHHRRAIRSYVGCPSAKDFVALWGFELNEMETVAPRDQFVSNSCGPRVRNSSFSRHSCQQDGVSSLAFELNSSISIFGAESEVGSSTQQSKAFYNGQGQQKTSVILQQILDLKRLQLTDRKNTSSLIRGQEQTDISSSKFSTSQRLDDDLDEHSQNSLGICSDLQQMDSPKQELKVEPFPSPFSQLEQLSSSSTVGIPLHGDPFWQCKSPIQSSQLWSQNMQDLGVCEDVNCLDDFNIPDVDLTFQNFEELFGGDQDPTRLPVDIEDVTYSSLEKDTSLDKSDDGCTRVMEVASVASSVCVTMSAHVDKDTDPSDQAHHFSTSVNSHCPIRPSFSAMSFSVSILSPESSSTDYLDSGLSPTTTRGPPFDSSDLESAHSEARENAMMRYKEKKKVRMNEKQIRHTPRKADPRKRVKGQSLKAEGYESDSVNATPSY
ncbi:putative zinc finger protein At1g68190 [Vitis riparia]|uniref:putative zinc finger protein At1g68190 n=1 Tax=Vitis riparia TaxID=96939 RepID=UPI00155A2E72|nr:putative zinc finger protein At1g68190 [Vitis riparia]XP_034690897.1 putative zinc finger protein At1g68190 [Vitis riparia]